MRSAAMTSLLLETALDCLYTLGYHRTTMSAIESRAGVSRGAFIHHFKTKDNLIAAAIEHLLKTETEEIRNRARMVSSERETLDEFIDYLWDTFNGPFFMIALEFITVARTEEKFREKIIPLINEFHLSLNEIWREFFHDSDASDTRVEDYLNLTLVVIRGLAFQTITKEDPDYYKRHVSFWKENLRMWMKPKGSPDSPDG